MAASDADNPKRAVVYARQSLSRNPEDSLSIEFQVRECQDFVARQGWVFVGSYSDPDTKGWKRHRPGFDAMIAKVQAGAADTVVMFKLSRFARGLMMQEEVVAQIASAGGDLVSITEPHMSTSPMIRQILGAVNENYRRDQSDFLTSAFRARALRGKHHGYAPFGYKIEHDALVFDPETEVWARSVWADALAGKGSYEIAARLNASNVPAPRGGRWRHDLVIRMLRRPVYAGHVALRDEIVVRDAHPALVTQGDWDRVQAVLARRSGLRYKDRDSWADGFVYHSCGQRMYLIGGTSKTGETYRLRYKCRGRYARMRHPESACEAPPASLRAEEVEERFLSALRDRFPALLPEEEAARRLDAALGGPASERDAARQRIEKQLATVEQKRDRLLDLALARRVDDDLYTQRDDTLKAELVALRDQLNAIPAPIDLAVVRRRRDGLMATLRALRNATLLGPPPADILHALDVRFIVDGDGGKLAFGGDTRYFFGV